MTANHNHEPTVLLARQPIFDRQRQVVAYELLFRPIGDMVSGKIDGDAATSQVITNAFTEIGLGKVTDNTSAYINYTPKWILNPPELDARVVVEVLEDVEINDSVLAQLKQLKAKGIEIALDDFTAITDDYIPALEIVDIVKVDLLSVPKEQLPALVKQLQTYKVKLVAEKVETHEEFQTCLALGFDLFQGYFLCKPENIPGKRVDSNKLVITKLLAALQDPDVTIQDLYDLISQDASFSYKLMRIVNSPLFYFENPVRSLKHALTVLGLKQIKSWASVIALTQLNDKPSALLMIGMQRAKMCELIAKEAELGTEELMFTVGLFSTLDAFLDRSLEGILEDITLTEVAKRALLRHHGVEGEILKTVKSHESGNWSSINWELLLESEITPTLVEQCYLDSLAWAKVTFEALQS